LIPDISHNNTRDQSISELHTKTIHGGCTTTINMIEYPSNSYLQALLTQFFDGYSSPTSFPPFAYV
jgi:hypothetical protein